MMSLRSLALVTAIVLATGFFTPGLAMQWRSTTGFLGAKDIALDGAGNAAIAGSMVGASFAVRMLDASDGSDLWTAPIAVGIWSGAVRVGFLGGDVVAAGYVDLGTGTSTPAALRLDRATGNTLWSYNAIGSAGTVYNNQASALLVFSGDVFLSGTLLNTTSTSRDGFVARLDGATGAEVWRAEFDGLPGDFAYETMDQLATDASGNIVAAGMLDSQLLVTKLDAATGAQVLQTTIADLGRPEAMAVASNGDVLIGSRPFKIVRLDGTTGAELWRVEFTGTGHPNAHDLHALQIAPNGDILAGGDLDNDGTFGDLTVARLDGPTGATIWLQEIDYNNNQDDALDLAIDFSGHIIVTGRFTPKTSSDRDLAALALDGASGDILWSRKIQTTPPSGTTGGFRVVVDGAGSAYIAGFDGTSSAIALDTATGIVGPVHGRKLKVSDLLGRADRRKLTALLKENIIVVPPAGSPNDPTIAGATVTLLNPISGESASFSLPGGPAWKGLGNPPGAKGYAYSDKAGAFGPCKTLRVTPGKVLKVSCTGTLAPIPFSLDEPTQGALHLSVRFGSAPAQCGNFGGTISADAGIGNPSVVGRFKAKAASSVGSCP